MIWANPAVVGTALNRSGSRVPKAVSQTGVFPYALPLFKVRPVYIFIVAMSRTRLGDDDLVLSIALCFVHKHAARPLRPRYYRSVGY